MQQDRTKHKNCPLESLFPKEIASAMVMVAMLLAGCQSIPQQPDATWSDWSPPPSTSLKPQTDLTQPLPSRPTVPPNAASATIRGQSPGNRYAQVPGSGQVIQNPLPGQRFPASTAEATQGSATVNPESLPPLGTGSATQDSYVVPGPYNPLAPNPAAPQNTYPSAPVQVAPQYGQQQAFQPPLGQPPQGPLGQPAYVPSQLDAGYGSAIAPGATTGVLPPGNAAIAPGSFPLQDPNLGFTTPAPTQYGQARERVTPLNVYLQEARTGRIILGGSVNSDLGVAGQLIIDERNFNIRRFPRSWDDIMSGRAFRGEGQNFRLELMPGNRVERYTASWTQRNLFGYLPYSLSVGGFYYTRQFRDWTEQRLGGRVALGYEVTKDIAISSELRMEDVKLFDPRIAGVQELDDSLGSNDIYTARFRVVKDTRDSPFMATQGALLEMIFDQVFGEYDFSRGAVNYSRYFKVRERPDGTGRHVIASTLKFGVTGAQTPIFENYFAGGYSTLRGFSFRGASPVESDVQVGGELSLLGSVEYVFPLTADDMLRGVAFIDYGTVERDIEINSENFRISPGLGLRVTVPALGPAPLAFDFAYPINHADTDDRQIFSFFMGFTR